MLRSEDGRMKVWVRRLHIYVSTLHSLPLLLYDKEISDRTPECETSHCAWHLTFSWSAKAGCIFVNYGSRQEYEPRQNKQLCLPP